MNQKWIKILISTLLFFSSLVYLIDRYRYVHNEIESVLISMNPVDYAHNLILYTAKDDEVDINFGKVYRADKINDTTAVVKFDYPLQLRKFRIYVQRPVHNLRLNSVKLVNKKDTLELDIGRFATGNRLNLSQTDGSNYSIQTKEKTGYIEYKTFIFKNDLGRVGLGITVALMLSLLSYLGLEKIRREDLPRFDLGKLSMIIFILSIYLPHPIFNITLMVALVLNLKSFKVGTLSSNWPSILFLLFFSCILLNDLFVSKEGIHNLRATEKALPFFALPFLFASVKPHNYLKYFLIMAVMMGIWLSLTSLLDILIYQNVDILSFSKFTKHINPIYFSYLLSVAIFYCQFYIKENYKYLLITFLAICLILSGSKAIISITAICFLLFVRSYKFKFAIIGGLVTLIFIFKPIQERFQKIIDLTDLSILNEKFIEDPRDNRINGLTFRLLLWQENLRINQEPSEILLGMGVGPAASEELRNNLVNRGLIEHQHYSTHNQYIATYWRLGLVGLSILLSIIIVPFIQALKTKNKLALIVIIILTVAMMSESVFGRVNGIYFFVTLILTLSNRNFFIKG